MRAWWPVNANDFLSQSIVAMIFNLMRGDIVMIVTTVTVTTETMGMFYSEV